MGILGGERSLDHWPVRSVHPAHAFMLAADFEGAAQVLRWVGGTAGSRCGAYTAFLFIQAKARDLWQDHALPIHFLVRTALAGSAALVIVALIFGSSTPGIDLAHWILVGTLAGHLALLAGHLHTGRLSTDGRTAARSLTGGRFRAHFWSAAIAGTAAPWRWRRRFRRRGRSKPRQHYSRSRGSQRTSTRSFRPANRYR